MAMIPSEDELPIPSEMMLFRTLYRVTPDFVWLRDLQGRYMAANPAYCAFMGRSESELVGQPLEALFPGELAETLRAQDREASESQVALSFETRITGANARTILAETSKIGVRDADGTLIGVLGIARDIAERREAEDALRASEERYRGFFTDSRAVMMLVDPEDGRIVDANAAACAYYGYSPALIRELRISDINMLTPEQVAAELQRAREQSRDHFYFPHRLADGRIRQVEVLSGPFIVGNRTLLYSIIHDITEQRLVEARVAESEALYRSVVNQVQDVIFQSDPEGRWTFLNPAWESITGYSISESLGKPYMDFIHPDDYAQAERAYATLLSGEKDGVQTELRWRHRDGGFRVVEGSVRVMTNPADPTGGVIGTAGTLRDVTEKRRAEEQQRLAASVFDHAHDGIVITDPHERIVDVNDTFCELTGYSRSEVLGQTPRLLSSGRQGPEFYSRMWKGLKQDGRWQGEIWNRRKNGDLYAELLTITAVRGASGETSHYVGVFSDITQSKRHEAELETAALHDSLTGLPNRILLGERFAAAVQDARQAESMLAIACLDLDGFKAINEEWGHAMGDRILVAMADRLRENLRQGDVLARLGGDEFVLLLDGLDSAAHADTELERVLHAIAQPLQVGGRTLNVTASIGYVMFPDGGDDADTLLRHAYQAMYHAKELGRNRIHSFDPAHGRRMQADRDIRMQIDLALSRQELVLYYQPKVELRTGRVIGAEALVRWKHPERGILGPGAFLPHIEDSDLIISVGDWVLEEALRQMAHWQLQGIPLPLSVNVAPRQLQTPDFCAKLAERLAAYPELPPGHLQIEVLESTALDDMARVGDIIAQCRAMGVSVALDDFGTGYSTLTYLKQLPADQLKIDKSFVGDMLADPGAQAIVDAVIGLAEAFKRTVIAGRAPSADSPGTG